MLDERHISQGCCGVKVVSDMSELGRGCDLIEDGQVVEHG